MSSPDPHRIDSVAALRAIVGEAGPAVEAKLGSTIEDERTLLAGYRTNL